MKKYIVLLTTILLLTGCDSEEEFDKTCTIKKQTPDITDTEARKIIYNNEDIVKEEILTRTYTAKTEEGKNIIKNIKTAAEDYNNNLAKSNNIKIAITKDTEDEYQTTYYIDVQKLTDKQLEKFELRKNSIKLFNKLKNDGIQCK